MNALNVKRLTSIHSVGKLLFKRMTHGTVTHVVLVEIGVNGTANPVMSAPMVSPCRVRGVVENPPMLPGAE